MAFLLSSPLSISFFSVWGSQYLCSASPRMEGLSFTLPVHLYTPTPPSFGFLVYFLPVDESIMSAFPEPRDIQYHESLSGLTLSEDVFLALLEKVIGESKYVQNNPRQGLVPEEGRVAAHILGELEPYSTSNGGPLEITKLEYVPNRPNIKIKLPGATAGTLA